MSAILCKGESVTASPTMRRIRCERGWRGDHENLYLDASCLTYGFGDDALARPPLATIDYSSMRSVTGAASSGGGYRSNRGGGVAITHSGDVIDGGRREGKHTIDVDLRALSDEVGALVFTMSAWTGRSARSSVPRCAVSTPTTARVSRCHVRARCAPRPYTAVMCRVWRPAVAPPGACRRSASCARPANGPNDTRGYAAIHEAIAKIGARRVGGAGRRAADAGGAGGGAGGGEQRLAR